MCSWTSVGIRPTNHRPCHMQASVCGRALLVTREANPFHETIFQDKIVIIGSDALVQAIKDNLVHLKTLTPPHAPHLQRPSASSPSHPCSSPLQMTQYSARICSPNLNPLLTGRSDERDRTIKWVGNLEPRWNTRGDADHQQPPREGEMPPPPPHSLAPPQPHDRTHHHQH